MKETLSSRHIVLVGVGHTNAHVVRMWGMHPIPDTDLTCVSDFPVATYSGMLPAVLARQKTRPEMEIDLVRLCHSVNARLIIGKLAGLDHIRREVLFDDRPAVPFDVLSVGIGSVPTTEGVSVSGNSLVTIKPMQTFQDRLAALVRSVAGPDSSVALRVVIVGSGVAGVEIAFCLPAFLRTVTARKLQLQMVTRSEEIMPGVASGTRQRALREMRRRDIGVTCGRAVSDVQRQHVVLDNGSKVDADVVIWATGAAAPPTLALLNLPTSERGFLLTDATLRCIDSNDVFAVGDTGTIDGQDVPKAGVYAVRQGPILWENIRRTLTSRTSKGGTLTGQPLQTYQPQRSFLKLLNTGDGRAIGQWKGLSFFGRWAWKLKDSIDSRFMEKFRPQSMMTYGGAPMQCKGCGCKLSSQTLDAALADSVALDDAADIGGDDTGRLLASTDFFSSPFDDAFLFGRIAALHSASDLVASGAVVTHALANVVVPEGNAIDQQRLLRDFLAGARLEFAETRADVVGGHTIVGPRFEAGFTVFGRTTGSAPLRKGGLKPGDRLLLTKPLGIGILLAAHMRSLCSAADYEAVVQTMLQRQHDVAGIAAGCGIVAATDVTGFGLAGHLLEMLRASRACATLQLTQIPILPGVASQVRAGVESSLAPGNRNCESQMTAPPAVRTDERYAALFDPQTCGGLLLGVPGDQCEQLVRAMTCAGHDQPACIGEVTESADAASGSFPLTVV